MATEGAPSSSSCIPTVLKLRARGPSGGAPLPLPEDLSSASTYGDLECAVRVAFSIRESIPIVILSGFPPKQLVMEEDMPLGSALPVNEILTIRQGEAGEAATVLQGTGAMKKGRGSGGAKAAASPGKRKAAESGPGSNVRTLSGPLHRSGGGGGGGRRGPKRVKGVTMRSEEDVGTLLVAAVAGGGGRVGQCLRAAFRLAVEKQYDEAKAQARVTAAGMGQYTITEMDDARRLSDGAAARMKVSFNKGLGARSNFEDEVDILPKLVLVTTLAGFLHDKNAREVLKPVNMAGLSPRFFWSIVKLYGGDVESGLRQLIPTQDWSFLNERVRKLSEKAQHNLEQEEELKRQKEEAARLRQEEREAKKARKEERVQARNSRRQVGEEKAAAADDVTDDNGVGDKGEETKEEALENLFPEEVDEWVDVLRKPPLRITHARDLSNQDAEVLGPRIRALGGPKAAAVTDEQVQSWIDASQQWELEDIMYELLEGDEAVYDSLVAADMALPKAVILWSAAPRAMIDTIREEVGEEEFEKIEEALTPENILKWATNAKAMIERMPWLNEWSATGNAPVEQAD